jgi:hypothetical protein
MHGFCGWCWHSSGSETFKAFRLFGDEAVGWQPWQDPGHRGG